MVSQITVIFASVLLLQTIAAQCIGHPGAVGNVITNASPEALLVNNMAHGPYSPVPETIPEIPTSFNGGGLKVTSYSPIAPSGITVQSDNLVVEGPLAVSGQLPFLGVVAVEGPLTATGQGAVTYACGNGNVGIAGEGTETGVAANLGVSTGLTDLGHNSIPNGLARGPLF